MSWLRTIIDIRKGERGKTAGMFLYFFIVIASYWFLKPLRSALTLEQLGADAIRQLKVITAFVSAGVVAAYSMALARFSRERLTYLVLGAFVWALVFFWFFFRYFGYLKVVYYCFYVFLDLFVTVNVALFWTFLADIMVPESARRLYGLIGAGGVIGGAVGSLSCNSLVQKVQPADMILYVAIAYSLNLLLVFLVTRRVRRIQGIARGIIATARESKFHDALAGARQVIRSPYFLGICLVLASYEFISTVDDFVFHKAVDLVFKEKGSVSSVFGTVLAWLSGATGLDVTGWFAGTLGLEFGEGNLRSFFSEFFFAMNLVALLVQTFLTSLIIRRFGMTAALLVLPVIILGLSAGVLALPALVLIETLFLADNSLNYSINQTSREMLFVPVPREEKYRALAFIDMLVLRAAKATGGFLLLLLPVVAATDSVAGLRWCMLLTIPLGIVSLFVSMYLGRKFRVVSELAAVRAESPQPASPGPEEHLSTDS